MNDEYKRITPLLTYIGSKDNQAELLRERMPPVAFESRKALWVRG